MDDPPPPPPPPPPPLSLDESDDMMAQFEERLKVRATSYSSPRPVSQSIVDLDNLEIPPPPPPPDMDTDTSQVETPTSNVDSLGDNFGIGPPPLTLPVDNHSASIHTPASVTDSLGDNFGIGPPPLPSDSDESFQSEAGTNSSVLEEQLDIEPPPPPPTPPPTMLLDTFSMDQEVVKSPRSRLEYNLESHEKQEILSRRSSTQVLGISGAANQAQINENSQGETSTAMLPSPRRLPSPSDVVDTSPIATSESNTFNTLNMSPTMTSDSNGGYKANFVSFEEKDDNKRIGSKQESIHDESRMDSPEYRIRKQSAFDAQVMQHILPNSSQSTKGEDFAALAIPKPSQQQNTSVLHKSLSHSHETCDQTKNNQFGSTPIAPVAGSVDGFRKNTKDNKTYGCLTTVAGINGNSEKPTDKPVDFSDQSKPALDKLTNSLVHSETTPSIPEPKLNQSTELQTTSNDNAAHSFSGPGGIKKVVSVRERIKSFSRYGRKNTVPLPPRSLSVAAKPSNNETTSVLRESKYSDVGPSWRDDKDENPPTHQEPRSRQPSLTSQRLQQLRSRKGELALELTATQSRNTQLRQETLRKLRQDKQENNRNNSQLERKLLSLKKRSENIHTKLLEFARQDRTTSNRRLELAKRYKLLLLEHLEAAKLRVKYLKSVSPYGSSDTKWGLLGCCKTLLTLAAERSGKGLEFDTAVMYHVLASLQIAVHESEQLNEKKKRYLNQMNSIVSNSTNVIKSSIVDESCILQGMIPFGTSMYTINKCLESENGSKLRQAKSCSLLVSDIKSTWIESCKSAQLCDIRNKLCDLESSSVLESTVDDVNRAELMARVREATEAQCVEEYNQDLRNTAQKQESMLSALTAAQSKRIVELGNTLARTYTNGCRQAIRDIDRKTKKLYHSIQHTKAESENKLLEQNQIELKRSSLMQSKDSIEKSQEQTREQCVTVIQQTYSKFQDLRQQLEEHQFQLPDDTVYQMLWEFVSSIPATESTNRVTRQQVLRYQSGCEIADMIYSLREAKSDIEVCESFVKHPIPTLKSSGARLEALGNSFGDRLVTFIKSWKRDEKQLRPSSRGRRRNQGVVAKVSVEAVVHNVRAKLRQHRRSLNKVWLELQHRVDQWEKKNNQEYTYGGQTFQALVPELLVTEVSNKRRSSNPTSISYAH